MKRNDSTSPSPSYDSREKPEGDPMDDLTLARVLGVLASDLEARGFPYSGPLRIAARRLFDLETDRCNICAGPIEQAATGRPRKYCSKRCRRVASDRTKAVK